MKIPSPLHVFRSLFVSFVLLVASPVQGASGFERFITVEGSSLMDGDEAFRFIAFNVPTLLYVEDEMAFEQTNPYSLPTEFELRDVFQTVVDMGGRVIRAYTIPVRNNKFPRESVTYVEAPGVFNEEAFKTMDLVVALAGEYGIRLVIPLLNNWEWMGGRPNYAEFRGKTSDEFWTNPQLIDDFKQTIHHVLNRRNTITGVRYKDDKTIMAWETGNELQNTADWAREIGKYIKSIDENHLLIDGFHAIHSDGHDVWIQPYSLEEPEFDLINTHHYETSPTATVENLKKTVEMVDGKKPVFLGEFGFISTTGIESILDYIISEPRIPGALIWSLRRHHKDGGFYHHSEPLGFGRYRAYHWPGFDDGEAYDERAVMRLMREKAFEIQGKVAPPLPVPKAPRLLTFSEAPVFSWQGSTGASGYDIERSLTSSGPWQRIAFDIDDIDTPGFPLFSDTTAKVGDRYFYRVVARNESGVSPASNIVGPVDVRFLTRTDKARNMAVLHESKDVSVRTGFFRSFKEAFSRLHGAKGGHIVYSAPGEMTDVRFFVFEKDVEPRLSFFESEDGMTWHPAHAEVEHFVSGEKNYDYLIPVRYSPSIANTSSRFIKASFSDEVDIVRVEIDYR